MSVVNKFNVNKQQVTLDADIIENMSANDVSYNSSLQYDENTVGNKLSELEDKVGINVEKEMFVGWNYISELYSISGKHHFKIEVENTTSITLVSKSIPSTSIVPNREYEFEFNSNDKDVRIFCYLEEGIAGVDATITIWNNTRFDKSLLELNDNVEELSTDLKSKIDKSSVVSTLGNSNTSILSQQASTKMFNNSRSLITINSNKLFSFERYGVDKIKVTLQDGLIFHNYLSNEDITVLNTIIYELSSNYCLALSQDNNIVKVPLYTLYENNIAYSLLLANIAGEAVGILKDVYKENVDTSYVDNLFTIVEQNSYITSSLDENKTCDISKIEWQDGAVGANGTTIIDIDLNKAIHTKYLIQVKKDTTYRILARKFKCVVHFYKNLHNESHSILSWYIINPTFTTTEDGYISVSLNDDNQNLNTDIIRNTVATIEVVKEYEYNGIDVILEKSSSGNAMFPIDIRKGKTYFVTGRQMQGSCSVLLWESETTEYEENSKSLGQVKNGQTIEFVADKDYKMIGGYLSAAPYKIRVYSKGELINGLPHYYYDNDYLDSKVNEIRTAMSLREGICFGFFTDLHTLKTESLSGNSGYSPYLFKYLMERLNIPFVICGGDIPCTRASVDDEVEGWEELLGTAQTWHRWMSVIGKDKVYQCRGNHDYLGYPSLTAKTTRECTPDELYPIVMNHEDVHHPIGKMYYYFDYREFRFIVTDDYGDRDSDESIYGSSCIGQTQYNWLVNEALNCEHKKIIIISHQTADAEIGTLDDAARPMLHKIMEALRNKTLLDESIGGIILNHDFSNTTNEFVMHLTGHVHVDRSNVLNNVLTIAQTCDCWSGYKPGGAYVGREPNTITEQALSIFCVNIKEKTIKSVRIGAGESAVYNW